MLKIWVVDNLYKYTIFKFGVLSESFLMTNSFIDIKVYSKLKASLYVQPWWFEHSWLIISQDTEDKGLYYNII